MAYIKNNWVDREGTTRYFETVDSDGAKIFTPDYTQVTELGTPVNADNMNHIEEGIAAGSFTKFDLNTTYGKNDLVTVIEDGSPVIYKSLIDNNIGNALSSSIAWEKISLGGGGGLEIGDIGIAPLGIDETKGKRRYLNGQVIIQDQYVQFTNKVKSAVALYPSLACAESEWQTTATMTVGGQVGKFVVDDEAGTIRLPKIIMPIQGLTDLSKLGEIVEAGLPNITGQIGSMLHYGDDNENGALRVHDRGNNLTFPNGSGSWGGSVITLNASKSNPIYNNSDTVQQEQIQYPYFIQVATGAETEDNIINEIELNNPFSLLDYKYSEYELNNISWLRSNGQYNAKAIYPAVYDLLLKIYNGTETKAGVSVKLSTEAFTDYDFVLNTAEETFRLPIKVKLASGKAVVGNGDTMFFNTPMGYTEEQPLIRTTTNVGNNSSLKQIAINPAGLSESEGLGLSTDPTKSGIETSDSGLYLYFYVGETVQNANLINAGRIEEKLSNYTTHNMVDGQWVVSKKQLLLNQTVSSSQDLNFDISDYLPNDGYDYEIIISGQASTGTGVDNQVYLLCGGGTGGVAITAIPLCYAVNQVSGKKQRGAGTAIIIVMASDRVVFVRQGEAAAPATVGYINLLAYRRIGTNL